jgi:CheY-like chemotaxis protein
MDVFLPGKMDTFTAAKEILETKNVSVIFLTTDPVSDNNTDIKIDGKVKFLQIPFTDKDLQQALIKVYPQSIQLFQDLNNSQ